MTKRVEHVVDSPAVGPRKPGRKPPRKPPGTAPSSRVTLREAAQISGLSEWAILNYIASDVIASEPNSQGEISIAREDLSLLRSNRFRLFAPPGRVTLREAAQLAGVTRNRVKRLVDDGLVPSERNKGRISIAREDIRLIQGSPQRPPAKVYKTVTVTLDPERYAAWERAAGRLAVSTWLTGLADRAAGYEWVRWRRKGQ